MAMMRSYIAELYRRLEDEEAKLEGLRKAQVTNTRNVKPLDQQLANYLATLPPSKANGPFLMSDLLPHTVGTYRGTAHSQMLGAILRQLGFERVRLYGPDFDGRRYWIRSSA